MVFNLANLPYWIFLGLGVVLFLFVIISGGGDDDLDLDADMDVDADLDAANPLDLGLDADAEFSSMQILGWLGIGRAPLLLLLALDMSLWGLSGWFFNVLFEASTGVFPAGLMTGLILGGSGAIALIIGSVIARPIGKIFASFSEDASDDRLLGCSGTVNSAFVPFAHSGKIGQVDALDATQNRVSISAILPDWATITLRRGAKVVIIDRHERAYVVIAADSPDQETWMSDHPSPTSSPPDSPATP